MYVEADVQTPTSDEKVKNLYAEAGVESATSDEKVKNCTLTLVLKPPVSMKK